jgi:hypothetical protein
VPAHADNHRALAADFAQRHDLPCLSCGYNVKGVASLICPECGKDMSDIALVRALHHQGATIEQIHAAVAHPNRPLPLPSPNTTRAAHGDALHAITRAGFLLGRFLAVAAFAVLVACIARRSLLPALYPWSAAILFPGLAAWLSEPASARAKGPGTKAILAWSWLVLMIATALAAR